MVIKEKVYIPKAAIVEVALGLDSKSSLALSIDKEDSLPNLTMEDVAEGYLTLKGAKVALDIAYTVYVRRLVKEGTLEGIKIAVNNSTRWLVTRESIEAYKVRRVRRGKKRNYTLRIDPSKEIALRKLLKDSGIEYTLELSYTSKGKGKDKEVVGWARVLDSIE